MPRDRRPWTLRVAGSLGVALLLAACSKKDAEPSTDPLPLIPADIHGVYGRTAKDTPGLTVDATGLAFGELRLTIHAGQLEGDTVRVERATVHWAKLEPKTCTGTIARQGDRLLLSLYEVGGREEGCDSVLAAEWFRWTELDALPEPLRGRYNVLTVGEDQLRLELGWFAAELRTAKIFELPGSNDERVELLVDGVVVSDPVGEGTDGEAAEGETETACAGTITLAEGWLESEFWVPAKFDGERDSDDPLVRAAWVEHDRRCRDWKGRAQKFEIELDRLPKAPIANAETTLTVGPERVELASPDATCSQELWRTESIASGRGVAGGERLTLGKAEPTEVSSSCQSRMRLWCERDAGNVGPDGAGYDSTIPPSEEVVTCRDALLHELCPSTITISPVSDRRYTLAVEPMVFAEIGCIDTRGDFTVQTPAP